MHVEGFGLSNFLSYGSTPQFFHPLKKVNLFIGPNNAGKSNALRFVGDRLIPALQFMSEPGSLTTNINKPAVERDKMEKVSLFFSPTAPSHISHILPDELWNTIPRLNDQPFMTLCRSNDNNKFVLDYEYCDNLLSEFERHFLLDYLKSMRVGFRGGTGDIIDAENVQNFFNTLPPFPKVPEPTAVLIPDIREIDRQSGGVNLYGEVVDGREIIKLVASLERPKGGDPVKKAKFKKLSKFLRDVIAEPSLRLEPSHEVPELMVYINEEGRNQNQLGAGIRSLIIIAVAATYYENRIICIEEPENHMHPSYQRRLIRFLLDTNNQYFIASHSAHFIDTPDVQVFHVTKENGFSKVACASTSVEKFEICASLGYRASDLLQSNCIIWVEGPSDRIYLNRWIKDAAQDELKEGLHYSIMFYGGSLGDHITGEDLVDEIESTHGPVEDLISLRRLNRNLAIIIDSDKRSEGSTLDPFKIRLENEFNKGPGFAWITKGRTTENYYSDNDMKAATKKFHPQSDLYTDEGKDPFSLHCTVRAKESKRAYSNKKVPIAEHVIANYSPRTDLDLKDRMNQLIHFIKQANDLS
ncbi:MAG: AAA family ATPase [Candidatus Melainabacteria bacterium]|nr:AAA family ATPase [Candidatus Melainabacteria bacterium]